MGPACTLTLTVCVYHGSPSLRKYSKATIAVPSSHAGGRGSHCGKGLLWKSLVCVLPPGTWAVSKVGPLTVCVTAEEGLSRERNKFPFSPVRSPSLLSHKERGPWLLSNPSRMSGRLHSHRLLARHSRGSLRGSQERRQLLLRSPAVSSSLLHSPQGVP